MGYIKLSYVCLTVGHDSINPLDSTIYYFSSQPISPTTNYNLRYGQIPVRGVIRSIQLAYKATAGTNEATPFVFRLNDTTDYSINATVDFSATLVNVSNLTMNIPVEVGDTFAVKFTCPAWAANPTTIYCSGYIVIEVG